MDMNFEATTGSGADQLKKGDAFDESQGPIIYMTDNRMPAIIELRSTIIYVIYAALILVLLLILPGVRRTKFKSFFTILTLLTVGASILLASSGSHWLVGRASLKNLKYSSLVQLDQTSISGRLEVAIGLNSANVSLWGSLDNSDSDSDSDSTDDQSDVMYNERFAWAEPDAMEREHRRALQRGLPYPILSVTEYLSHDSDGFNWSRQLRSAGHFASMALRAALMSWCLTAVCMCALPSLLGLAMLLTGSLMMVSVGVYTLMAPPMDQLDQMRLLGASQPIEFDWGSNYWSTQVVGLLTILAGLILFLLQEHSAPGEPFTIMESEKYALDRKALFTSLSVHSPTATATMDSKPTARSVIIPIGDIEQSFKPASR